MAMKSYKKTRNQVANSNEYWIEKIKLEFTRGIVTLMDKKGINRKSLSDILGVKGPQITKLLSGDQNPTLETMVKTVRACGGRIHLHISDSENKVRWFEYARSTNFDAMISDVKSPLEPTSGWSTDDIVASKQGEQEENVAA